MYFDLYLPDRQMLNSRSRTVFSALSQCCSPEHLRWERVGRLCQKWPPLQGAPQTSALEQEISEPGKIVLADRALLGALVHFTGQKLAPLWCTSLSLAFHSGHRCHLVVPKLHFLLSADTTCFCRTDSMLTDNLPLLSSWKSYSFKGFSQGLKMKATFLTFYENCGVMTYKSGALIEESIVSASFHTRYENFSGF